MANFLKPDAAKALYLRTRSDQELVALWDVLHDPNYLAACAERGITKYGIMVSEFWISREELNLEIIRRGQTVSQKPLPPIINVRLSITLKKIPASIVPRIQKAIQDAIEAESSMPQNSEEQIAILCDIFGDGPEQNYNR